MYNLVSFLMLFEFQLKDRKGEKKKRNMPTYMTRLVIFVKSSLLLRASHLALLNHSSLLVNAIIFPITYTNVANQPLQNKSRCVGLRCVVFVTAIRKINFYST